MVDTHDDLPTAELLAEAERIAANLHKDGRYLAASVLRILCHRLAALSASGGGGMDDSSVSRAVTAFKAHVPTHGGAAGFAQQMRAALLAAAPKPSEPLIRFRHGDPVTGSTTPQADPAPPVADPGFDRDAEWCHANPYDAASHIRAVARIVAEKDAFAEVLRDAALHATAQWRTAMDERKAAKARADALAGALQECEAVAVRRGDKYGLCDAIDNDGTAYQSHHLAKLLSEAGK